MSPLVYLFLHKLKNRIKSFFKSPGKIIYAVFMIACIGMVIFSTMMAKSEKTDVTYRDINELYAGLLAFLMFLSFFSIKSGFSTGATIFSMPDVNFIFTAPFKTWKILLYGMIQQLGTSLLLGVFLIYQYSWTNQLYGITMGELIIILLAYSITLFIAQILSMNIYAFTSGTDKARRIGKIIFYLFMLVPIAFCALQGYFSETGFIAGMIEGTKSAFIEYYPLYGWVMSLAIGIIEGELIKVIICLVLIVATISGLFAMLANVKTDFFEDVLQTTESSYSTALRAKEGRISENVKDVKIGKTGIGEGFGADVFYYKHMIENRRGKAKIMSVPELVLCVILIVMAYFMKSDGNLLIILGLGAYFKLFTIGMGRITKELTKHFVYMVPEASFKKIIYCSLEAIPGYVFEALLIFIPAGIIMGASMQEIVLVAIARITYSFLFLAGSLFMQRVLGSLSGKMLALMLYMILMILLTVPGIVAAVLMVVFEVIIFSSTFTAAVMLAIFNILLALLAMFLARNILEYPELNN